MRMAARYIALASLFPSVVSWSRAEVALRASFPVTSTADTGDGDLGDGVCDTGTQAAPTGICTLRAAIDQANSTPGADAITFAIGTGAVTISTFGYVVTDAVVVDGTTQPGYSGTPIVTIDGSPGAFSGFDLSADGTTIRGLAIVGSSGYGVRIKNSNNAVQSNYVGVAADGSTAGANGTAGIYIDGTSTNTPTNNRIGGVGAGEGNVVSGNTGDGILISGSGATGNFVTGNVIGTDAPVSVALGNNHGVNINNSSGNTIGGSIGLSYEADGTCTGECNIISGNSGDGIILQGGATNNNIVGNFIGAGSTQGDQIGNLDDGVSFVNANGNQVGGNSTPERNLIAYNLDKGVFSSAPGTNLLTINDITDNGQLGVDWAVNGVSVNDVPDADGIVNYPEIDQASGTTIHASVTTNPIQFTTLHFWSNDECDGSGYGEGGRYLGSASGTTDGSGELEIVWEIVGEVGDGDLITAAASSDNGSSEFSTCLPYTEEVIVAPLVVNSTNDADDGTCNATHCSLREAIAAANLAPGPDAISFNLLGTPPFLIQPTSALPTITDPVTLAGQSQPGYVSGVIIEIVGSSAGPSDGLVIEASSTIQAIAVTRFQGNGIVIEGAGADGTSVIGARSGVSADIDVGAGAQTQLWGNGLAGILVDSDVFIQVTIGGPDPADGNLLALNTPGIVVDGEVTATLLSNRFLLNTGPGIDLGNDGVSPNDVDDADSGPNDLLNFPEIDAVYRGSVTLDGTYSGLADAEMLLQFYSVSLLCDDSGHGEGDVLLGSETVITDGAGLGTFSVTFSREVPAGTPVTATATDPDGNTSEFSACAPVADFSLEATPDSIGFPTSDEGTFEITVVAEEGVFNGEVTLSCPDLDESVTCSFDPGVVVPGDSDATSTLTVSTTLPIGGSVPLRGFVGWLLLGGSGLGLLGLGRLASGSGPGSGHRRRAGSWVGAAMVITALLSACADTTGPGSSFTATIEVVGSSGSLERTVEVKATIIE